MRSGIRRCNYLILSFVSTMICSVGNAKLLPRYFLIVIVTFTLFSNVLMKQTICSTTHYFIPNTAKKFTTTPIQIHYIQG